MAPGNEFESILLMLMLLGFLAYLASLSAFWPLNFAYVAVSLSIVGFVVIGTALPHFVYLCLSICKNYVAICQYIFVYNRKSRLYSDL